MLIYLKTIVITVDNILKLLNKLPKVIKCEVVPSNS